MRGDFSPKSIYLRLCPFSPSWLFLQSKAFDNADFVVLDLTCFAAKLTGPAQVFSLMLRAPKLPYIL